MTVVQLMHSTLMAVLVLVGHLVLTLSRAGRLWQASARSICRPIAGRGCRPRLRCLVAAAAAFAACAGLSATVLTVRWISEQV